MSMLPKPLTTICPRPVAPDRNAEMFALDADLTVYWPWVRPCWEESA